MQGRKRRQAEKWNVPSEIDTTMSPARRRMSSIAAVVAAVAVLIVGR